MSESQLPADRTSRIRQGFTASLLLTSLLFFWILVVANEPKGVGEALYRGGGACRQLAGRQAPGSPGLRCTFCIEPPVARVLGDRMVFLQFLQTGWYFCDLNFKKLYKLK